MVPPSFWESSASSPLSCNVYQLCQTCFFGGRKPQVRSLSIRSPQLLCQISTYYKWNFLSPFLPVGASGENSAQAISGSIPVYLGPNQISKTWYVALFWHSQNIYVPNSTNVFCQWKLTEGLLLGQQGFLPLLLTPCIPVELPPPTRNLNQRDVRRTPRTAHGKRRGQITPSGKPKCLHWCSNLLGTMLNPSLWL